MPLLISEEDIPSLLSVREAIPIVEEVFREAGEGVAENPARYRLPIRKGFLQFGPAALHRHQVMGFKLWANFGSPLRQVWNFLFDIETSELVAIIQAHLISKYRTCAVTATAVKHLSPPEASVVGMYGAGRQAEAQIEAITLVRPIRRVRVYSRTAEKREAFARKMSERLGIEVVPVAAPEEVPGDADIVITITSAETPVLHGDWIRRPCLVVGAGANHWYEREIDGTLVGRAALIVVDEKEQAKVEGGDLLWAIGHGLLTWDRVEELGDAVIGRVPLPDLSKELVLFESHGVAITDMAVSRVAYERARERGIGRQIEL
jgi:ornithine cyclodeaminase/alanine dehydrogenase-like protein (mu-crystallin family)